MSSSQISRETGFSEEQIFEIIRKAPHSYRVYSIPKRNGDGFRLIEHPSRQLKTIQRWLADRLLVRLPIHDAVFSYRPNLNVRDHASVHASSNYLLRIDLRDFFPSIKRHDVEALLSLRAESLQFQLSAEDLSIVARVVCKGDRLTIGAPSSPVLSNAVLYGFDVRASQIAATYQATYTRYADDLYFSTDAPDVLSRVLEEVRNALNDLPFPQVFINEEKTIFTSRKRRKVVTGIVVTPDKKLSLGREKKRYIRSLLFQFASGSLDEKSISYLKGYLAYCAVVEPEFIDSLKRKYGEAQLVQLNAAPTVMRKAPPSKKK